MRCLVLWLPALLIAGAASAQTITVEKGQWTYSTDIYLSGQVDGESIDEPTESMTDSECWALDEEVELDESMILMEDCETVAGHHTDYALDMTLRCLIGGIPMDGSVVMATNAARDMVSGRFLIHGKDTDYQIRVEGIIFARRTGACSAQN